MFIIGCRVFIITYIGRYSKAIAISDGKPAIKIGEPEYKIDSRDVLVII